MASDEPYSCPECGYSTDRLKDNLECVSTGPHADMSVYRCPDCGEETFNQGWAESSPPEYRSRSPGEMQAEIERLKDQ